MVFNYQTAIEQFFRLLQMSLVRLNNLPSRKSAPKGAFILFRIAIQLRSMLHNLLLLLFAGLMLPINGNSAPNVNKIKRETPVTSKTVYVDLSLNSKFLESAANPYFHYGETNVSLVLDSNDIYHSEFQLPVEVFTTGFELCSFSGLYKTDLITDSLLKEDRYNYICLATYVDGSNASIEGYGFYGEKVSNPDPTYKTHRVWLNNNNSDFYNNDSWGNK